MESIEWEQIRERITILGAPKFAEQLNEVPNVNSC
jgi:hypothetical protein